MNAIILSVGDELVLGQTVDTNSAWLSRELAAVGCAVRAHWTVPDDERAIGEAMLESFGRCDFLLVSGGIGPTEDDLTRQALAGALGSPLEMNEAQLARLRQFFEGRGRPMPQSNRIQAMIPRGARMIENPNGTAAGIEALHRGDDSRECRIFIMPGVPKEMKAMFIRDVLPRVREAGGGACIASRTLHTFGVGESAVAEAIGEAMMRGKNPSVGTTVSGGIVSIRINANFDSNESACRKLEETEAACRAALGDIVFGRDDESLQSTVAKMIIDRPGVTVTTAESCTGGLLAKMLTDVSGSSAYFKTGFVTYSNDAKYERLGVNRELLHVHGAVSEPVVEAMAGNARKLAKATIGLSVSGIAGPTGGTTNKPVGTVCIGMAHPHPERRDDTVTRSRTFHFTGDREMVRDRAAKMAMSMLRYHLMGKPMPF